MLKEAGTEVSIRNKQKENANIDVMTLEMLAKYFNMNEVHRKHLNSDIFLHNEHGILELKRLSSPY